MGGIIGNTHWPPCGSIRALICAWGGVLRACVGVLWELRYKGLWMTPMDNNYRPETLIRDICGGNQRQHTPASPCVGCPDAQGQRVCRKHQKTFSCTNRLRSRHDLYRVLKRAQKLPFNPKFSRVHLARVLPMDPSFGGPENTFFAKTSGKNLFLRQTLFNLV